MTTERPMPPVAESVDLSRVPSVIQHPASETLVSNSPKPTEGLSRRLMLAAGLAAVAIPATPPVSAVVPADPIYDVIEKHRDACKARSTAVHAECGYETEHGVKSRMTPEQRRIYDELAEATSDAWDYLDDVSAELLTTKPTTFAGVIALCEYFTPLLEDPHLVDLPESIVGDDDTQSTTAGAFANVVAKSLRDIADRGQS